MNQNPEIIFINKTKKDVDNTPIKNGCIYFTTDTKEIFVDMDDERKLYTNKDVNIFPEGYGTNGQFATSNGKGGLIFKTIENAEGVYY